MTSNFLLLGNTRIFISTVLLHQRTPWNCMLVSGRDYKILLISTRIIYTKNIFTQKIYPSQTIRQNVFVTRQINSIIFVETNLLLIQTNLSSSIDFTVNRTFWVLVLCRKLCCIFSRGTKPTILTLASHHFSLKVSTL